LTLTRIIWRRLANRRMTAGSAKDAEIVDSGGPRSCVPSARMIVWKNKPGCVSSVCSMRKKKP